MCPFNPDSRSEFFKYATLVDLLRSRAAESPDKLAYIFLLDGEVQEERITYGELHRQAQAIGAWLQSLGAAGERAVLLYPPGLGYIAAFFGCLYAGVVAVPAYPPRLNRPVPRIQGIVADSQAIVSLTTSAILENIEQRFEHAPDLKALHWLDTEKVPAGIEANWTPPAITGESLAFFQYTSGSTSQPKGVMLSHANLLYNLEMIRCGFHLEKDITGVLWLPSYHDMGLIGGILEPMYTGGMSVLMSPLFFLQRPYRWLEALSRYKGNVAGGPNFSYDLCIEKISPEQRQKLDLSHWQLAFSGAEPVRAGTLERFAATFAECGFRAEAFYPCYGLAEASLIVSGGDGPAKQTPVAFRRSALEEGRVVLAVEGDNDGGAGDSQLMISCGQPLLEEKVVIANPHTLAPCAPDEIGEIWVSGQNVAQGYWRRPDETERTFGARLNGSGEGPFMRTGDLGFFHNGELFIAGRLKDLIIIRGSNHYPQDIELTVEQSHPGLQSGGGAAFSVTVGDEEQLVVVQELSRQQRNAPPDEIFRAIRRAVSENHDLQIHAVVLIKPLSIPKTSSGKIQRHACKAAFLDGSLETIAEWRAGMK